MGGGPKDTYMRPYRVASSARQQSANVGNRVYSKGRENGNFRNFWGFSKKWGEVGGG